LVLTAQKTWVGYAPGEKPYPPLRPAVLGCNGVPLSVPNELPQESLKVMNYWYAHDYETLNDLRLLLRRYKQLGM
jgi:hypothetical protein